MDENILLVDDDRIPMRYYVQALEETGFAVKQCFTPDETFDYLKKEDPELSLVVLDIMMLPGQRYTMEETKDGTITGKFIFQDISELYDHIPILILTNVDIEMEVAEYLQQQDNVAMIVKKANYTPFEFAKLVKSILSPNPSDTNNSRE